MDSRAVPSSWWFAWVTGKNGVRSKLTSVESSVYPDGTLVEVDATQEAAGLTADWVAAAELDRNGKVTAIVFADRGTGLTPPMWFVEVRESARQPPATNLLAFTGHGQPTGLLLDAADFSNTPAASADQLGAVHFYPVSGVIDQIYVAPDWRRRGIGTALTTAVSVLSIARGWPRPWAQGQRTELGERFRNGSRWWPRTDELTHLHPPMTPGEAGSADGLG
jgi:GNAT superfamily N-acetyltransferase